MFGLDIIFKFIKLLNSDKHSPAQLAAGLTVGMIMGLTPWFHAHHIILFVFLLLFNVNFSMAFLGMAVFKLVGFALDGYFHDLGYYILTLESLKPTFKQWYNSPMVLTKFNNTVLMGSFVGSILVSPIAFVLFWFLIKKYRKHFSKWYEKSWVKALLSETKLFNLYDKIQG